MTLISKTAGALSLGSCLLDVHKTAMIYSRNARCDTMGNSYIEKAARLQRANHVSYKDSERKNWLLENNFFASTKETIGAIKGYFKGAIQGLARYAPNVVLSTIAICAKKNKTVANIAAMFLGGVELFDFIHNSTTINQKEDYLK